MTINLDNPEFEIQFADSLEILTNVEYLWSQTVPLSIEQAGYLEALRSEMGKLEGLLQDIRQPHRAKSRVTTAPLQGFACFGQAVRESRP